MPNQLTQSRQLGFPLVGKDGFLTGLAKAQFGYGPLAQIQMAQQARKDFDSMADSDLKRRTGEQNLEQGQQQIEQSRFNLGRAPVLAAQHDTDFANTQTQFNQGQAEREGKSKYLSGLFPTAASPDEAMGMASGKAADFALQNANPKEKLLPEMAEMIPSLHGRGGKEIDRSQLGQIQAITQHRETEAARLAAAREAAAARADNRQGQMSLRRDNTNMGHGRDYQQEVKPLIVVTNAARRAQNISDYIKVHPEALGPGSEAVVADWERQLDPMSVIREGEFTRALAGTPYASQAEVFVQRLTGAGGHLTPQLLKQFVDLIGVAAKYSRERGSSRYKDYLSLVGGDKRFIGDDPFNEGFDTAPQGGNARQHFVDRP